MLPGAVAECGWLPGFLALGSLFILQLALVNVIIEAPRLAEKSLESYEDIARACLGRPGYVIASVTIFGAFFAGCTAYLSTAASLVPRPNNCKCDVAFVGVCLLVLPPVAFKYLQVRALNLTSKIAVVSMYMLIVLVACCGVTNRLFFFASTYTAVTDLQGFLSGLCDMALTFTTLNYFPYLLADMYDPEDAWKVCNSVYRHIALCYWCIAAFGYIGWGDAVARDVATSIVSLSSLAGLVFHAILIVRSLAAFTLLFAPLTRSVQAALPLEQDPALAIGLPWALRRLRRLKIASNACLVLLTFLFYAFARHVNEQVLKIAAGSVTYILPPLISMGLERHSHAGLFAANVCSKECTAWRVFTISARVLTWIASLTFGLSVLLRVGF